MELNKIKQLAVNIYAASLEAADITNANNVSFQAQILIEKIEKEAKATFPDLNESEMNTLLSNICDALNVMINIRGSRYSVEELKEFIKYES